MRNNSPVRRYSTTTQARTGVDAGLRAYMLSVYNYMALGLGLTGLTALAVASSPALLNALFATPLAFLVMLAPLGFVFFLSARINQMEVSTAQAMFWAYAAVNGVSLSIIFLGYTGESIARTFFVTAGAFAGLSLYGYTTRRNLTAFGSFLMMGVIGLVLTMLVNIFMQSSALNFAISVIGVFVFAGLTAYDTQRIKLMYYATDDADTASRKAIMGALNLYLDFINLFLMLLRLMGDRR